MSPQLIFGTASFGMDLTEFQDPQSVNSILNTLREISIHRLDSGARYPPMKPGLAETLIGQTKDLSHGFVTDTKVYTNTQTDGSGDLTGEAIEKSMLGSLQRLDRSKEGVSCALRLLLISPSSADARSMFFTHIELTLPRR